MHAHRARRGSLDGSAYVGGHPFLPASRLLADAIRDGLRLEAIAADLAGDGDTALELLSYTDYDVAVLDRDVPGTSGDAVAAPHHGVRSASTARWSRRDRDGLRRRLSRRGAGVRR
ncbi:hypothetical protein PP359_05770 [Sphingomonas sp. BLCC-B65]|nr:hypothetical protein [Sphingomonas sp. BLCC-B65]